jgi:hypothetical protein
MRNEPKPSFAFARAGEAFILVCACLLMALHVILMRRWTRSRSGCSGHGWTERWLKPIANDPTRKSSPSTNCLRHVIALRRLKASLTQVQQQSFL